MKRVLRKLFNRDWLLRITFNTIDLLFIEFIPYRSTHLSVSLFQFGTGYAFLGYFSYYEQDHYVYVIQFAFREFSIDGKIQK